MQGHLTLTALVALLVFGSACSFEPPSRHPLLTTGDLLPLQTGNRWTYRVTEDDGDAYRKVTRVGAAERVGGSGPQRDRRAFRVETMRDEGERVTVSWRENVDDSTVRYREQLFEGDTLVLEKSWRPFKVHVDGSFQQMTGSTRWLEEYDETVIAPGPPQETTTRHVETRWEVRRIGARVRVPAGTFVAVELRKYRGQGYDDEATLYYVPGIGKVKEEGDRTEELVSFEVR